MGATLPNLKYSQIERERRFLLRESPQFSRTTVRRVDIHDRYLRGTRLRLRVAEEAGRPLVRKLGQKVRLKEESGSVVAHTTMYLSESEFIVLRDMPSDALRKTRYMASLDDVHVAVDVFRGEHAGLVMAEVDLGELGVMPERLPFTPVREVTHEERFTGGSLATMDRSQVECLLAERG